MSWDILPKNRIQYIFEKLKTVIPVVKANPSDTATDNLTKLDIDGTIYDVVDADAVHTDDVGTAAAKDFNNEYNPVSEDVATGMTISDATEVKSLSDTTPYLYRKSPAIGTRVMENALVGASVVVNQLVQNVNTWSAANATGSVSDNVLTFTATATRGRYYSQKDLPTVVDHVVLVCAQIKTTTATSQVQLYSYGGYAAKFCKATTNWQSVYILTKTNSAWGTDLTNNNQLSVQDYRTGSWDAIQVKNPQVIDLTVLFGSSTIPDAAYTKETAQAGSGISWLKDNGFDFSKYIAYNTGELESVNPSAKKVVGFNQWDEVTESGYYFTSSTTGKIASASNATTIRSKNPIPVIPNETYYATSNVYKCFVTDADGYVLIETPNHTITMPDNAAYLYFFCENTTTYNHDICINISKTTGTPKNGDYLPYEEHTYPISPSSPSPLRGLFVLDGDEIKASGDVRKSDGSTTRVRGSIDLGTLNWTRSNNSGTWNNYLFFVNISNMKSNTNSLICPKYMYGGGSAALNTLGDKLMATSSNYFYVRDDAYTDATTFKQAMSDQNVKLEYELAAPTTEQLAPFDNPQISIVGGTEEFITDNDVPVGHESEYKALPALFEDDYVEYLQEQAEAVKGKADKAMSYLQYISDNTPTDFNNITLSDASGQEMGYPLADTEFLNHRFILVEVYKRNSTPADLLLCGSALLYVDSLIGFLQGSSIRIGGLPLSNSITADAKFRLYYDDVNNVYRAGIGFESNASTALTGYYIRARLVD